MYNRRAIIGRAIDSVLRQDFTDFELIVVDDGSADGGDELVAQIADPRVRMLRQPGNFGANAARNRGIRESSAPIIALLDSDDEYLPAKLGAIVETFDRQPDLGLLLDSYRLVVPGQNNGLPQDRINPVIETSEAFLAGLFDSSVRKRRMRKSASGISVRREVAFQAGLFDETLARRQDIDFLARVARVARCATTDRQLWVKHETTDSISAKSRTFITATLVLCRRNPEYLSNRVLRAGLLRDIARHFYVLARDGRWSEAGRDWRELVGELGLSQTARLVITPLMFLRGRAA
jgi:glycosyltransferase involved in cell wall biosynthesis